MSPSPLDRDHATSPSDDVMRAQHDVIGWKDFTPKSMDAQPATWVKDGPTGSKQSASRSWVCRKRYRKSRPKSRLQVSDQWRLDKKDDVIDSAMISGYKWSIPVSPSLVQIYIYIYICIMQLSKNLKSNKKKEHLWEVPTLKK